MATASKGAEDARELWQVDVLVWASDEVRAFSSKDGTEYRTIRVWIEGVLPAAVPEEIFIRDGQPQPMPGRYRLPLAGCIDYRRGKLQWELETSALNADTRIGES